MVGEHPTLYRLTKQCELTLREYIFNLALISLGTSHYLWEERASFWKYQSIRRLITRGEVRCTEELITGAEVIFQHECIMMISITV